MTPFNVQCLLSKLEIKPDDEVVVFPLFQKLPHKLKFTQHLNLKQVYEKTNPIGQEYLKKHLNVFNKEDISEDYEVHVDMPDTISLYPGENWQIGFPFIGKYQDKGYFSINQTDQLGLNIFLDTIKLNGLPANKKNYAYSTINFNPQNIGKNIEEDIFHIQEAVMGEQLFIVSGFSIHDFLYKESYTPVCFSYIHKKVYDFIMNFMAEEESQIQIEIEKHLENVLPYLEEEHVYYEAGKKKESYDFKKLHLLREKQSVSFLEEEQTHNIFSFFYNKKDINAKKYTKDFMEGEEKRYVWTDKEAYRNILLLKLKCYLVNKYMHEVLQENWKPLRKIEQAYKPEYKQDFVEFIYNISNEKKQIKKIKL